MKLSEIREAEMVKCPRCDSKGQTKRLNTKAMLLTQCNLCKGTGMVTKAAEKKLPSHN